MLIYVSMTVLAGLAVAWFALLLAASAGVGKRGLLLKGIAGWSSLLATALVAWMSFDMYTHGWCSRWLATGVLVWLATVMVVFRPLTRIGAAAKKAAEANHGDPGPVRWLNAIGNAALLLFLASVALMVGMVLAA